MAQTLDSNMPTMRRAELMRQKKNPPVAKSHDSVCFWKYEKIANMKIISFNIMDERIIAGTDVSRRGGKK